MTKKHEELVEEMYGKMANFFGGLVVYPEIKVPMSERLAFTKQLIALVLSAVRDGRLDEELGVVGRWNPYDRKSFRIWLDELPGGETFIALRPLTGTGKEEE